MSNKATKFIQAIAVAVIAGFIADAIRQRLKGAISV